MTDTTPDPDPGRADDAAPVTVIRNIGPALAGILAQAGIETAGALRQLGADEAYRHILRLGTRPHFITYYVLHMSLQGRPWNDCQGAEKTALRAQFDALKAREAASGNDPELERFLDTLGTGLRR
jgi:hypothetical protein